MGMERNTAHQYISQRGKNPFEKNLKKPLHSTWAFLLKSLDIFSLKKLGPEKLITSYLILQFSLLQSKVMQIRIFITIVRSEISPKNF